MISCSQQTTIMAGWCLPKGRGKASGGQPYSTAPPPGGGPGPAGVQLNPRTAAHARDAAMVHEQALL